MQGPIIDIERVSFAYDGQPVLEDISLRVDPGDFLAVLGPNGGGKTTLLRLVLGLLAPSAGSIRVFGREPRLAAGRIGYVPQVVDVRPDFPMTVLDATLMGLMTPGGRGRRPGPAERDAAREALERVGLAGRENARIGELSRRPEAAGLHRPGPGLRPPSSCSWTSRPRASTPRASSASSTSSPSSAAG